MNNKWNKKKDETLYLFKDQQIEYLKKSDNTLYVSYQRTGSHWIRLSLEYYFNKPVFPMSHYADHNIDSDVLYFHTHVLDTQRLANDYCMDVSEIKVNNLLYQYRENYKEVIYSFVNIYDQYKRVDDPMVGGYCISYADHLNYWLGYKFSGKRYVFSYEDFKRDYLGSFKDVLSFFGIDNPNENKILECKEKITKEEVNYRLENRSPGMGKFCEIENRSQYYEEREKFLEKYSDFIDDIFLSKIDGELFNKYF